MAELKTTKTGVPVADFVALVPDPRRRAEAESLVALMSEVTGEPGAMWGPSIIGFGLMHYTGASGREGDWPKVGFSPRKAAISLYGLRDSVESSRELDALGPHTTGVGCVYVKRLDQIDLDVLRRIVEAAYAKGDYVAPKRVPRPPEKA